MALTGPTLAQVRNRAQALRSATTTRMGVQSALEKEFPGLDPQMFASAMQDIGEHVMSKRKQTLREFAVGDRVRVKSGKNAGRSGEVRGVLSEPAEFMGKPPMGQKGDLALNLKDGGPHILLLISPEQVEPMKEHVMLTKKTMKEGVTGPTRMDIVKRADALKGTFPLLSSRRAIEMQLYKEFPTAAKSMISQIVYGPYSGGRSTQEHVMLKKSQLPRLVKEARLNIKFEQLLTAEGKTDPPSTDAPAADTAWPWGNRTLTPDQLKVFGKKEAADPAASEAQSAMKYYQQRGRWPQGMSQRAWDWLETQTAGQAGGWKGFVDRQPKTEAVGQGVKTFPSHPAAADWAAKNLKGHSMWRVDARDGQYVIDLLPGGDRSGRKHYVGQDGQPITEAASGFTCQECGRKVPAGRTSCPKCGSVDLDVSESVVTEADENNVWVVHIPANIYDGKYYDYRTVRYNVPMTVAKTAKDADKWVNAHKKEVLAKVDKKKTQGGRNYVAHPVEKNVFFKSDYHSYPAIVYNLKQDEAIGPQWRHGEAPGTPPNLSQGGAPLQSKCPSCGHGWAVDLGSQHGMDFRGCLKCNRTYIPDAGVKKEAAPTARKCAKCGKGWANYPQTLCPSCLAKDLAGKKPVTEAAATDFTVGDHVTATRYGQPSQGTVTKVGKSIVFVQWDGVKVPQWMHPESLTKESAVTKEGGPGSGPQKDALKQWTPDEVKAAMAKIRKSDDAKVSGFYKNLKGAIQGKKPVKEAKLRKFIRTEVLAALKEVSPPGWSGTVKHMKKHGDISNPFALAWSMKKKGDKPHIKPEK